MVLNCCINLNILILHFVRTFEGFALKEAINYYILTNNILRNLIIYHMYYPLCLFITLIIN